MGKKARKLLWKPVKNTVLSRLAYQSQEEPIPLLPLQPTPLRGLSGNGELIVLQVNPPAHDSGVQIIFQPSCLLVN